MDAVSKGMSTNPTTVAHGSNFNDTPVEQSGTTNLENHSKTFSLADNVDNYLNSVNTNEQYAITKRARLPTIMETSTQYPPAVVSNWHCEQSPTIVTTISGPSTETPSSQSTSVETCNSNPFITSPISSGNKTRTESSVETSTTSDGGCPVTIPLSRHSPALNITASSEDSSIKTPKGNDATVHKTSSSSGHANNTFTERISKYFIQYVPETAKRKKGGSLKRVIGQRVLTSTEGLAILKEKEKKQKKAQEIEQQKRERENKKKEKEAEVKRKADEKLKNTTRNTNRKRSAASTRAANKKSKSIEQSADSDQPYTSSMSGRITDSPTPTEGRHVEEDAICCKYNVSYEDDIRCNRGEEWV